MRPEVNTSTYFNSDIRDCLLKESANEPALQLAIHRFQMSLDMAEYPQEILLEIDKSAQYFLNFAVPIYRKPIVQG